MSTVRFFKNVPVTECHRDKGVNIASVTLLPDIVLTELYKHGFSKDIKYCHVLIEEDTITVWYHHAVTNEFCKCIMSF